MTSHYFQEGSHTLVNESGYLTWINPQGNYHGNNTVDYELCAAISAMSVKLCSPLVKNTALVVPKNHTFTYPHLKSIWDHIIEWEFTRQNFWKDDLTIMSFSPFKYTMRLDSDVIVTSEWVNEIWHQIWHMGYAITHNIADLNGAVIQNPYRTFADSVWTTHQLPHAYIAVMGANLQHKKFQKLLRGWKWALHNAHQLRTHGHVPDSDELLSLSLMHSNAATCESPFFVHAKPLCLFGSPIWNPVSQLTCYDGVWRISNVPQHLPIHMAEKSLLTASLAQQLWRELQ
jgi:hypothetical protein